MSTKPGMLSTMSGRLSTYPVKRLSTTSGNKQKTVNRNQEKTVHHNGVTVVTVLQLYISIFHSPHKNMSIILYILYIYNIIEVFLDHFQH